MLFFARSFRVAIQVTGYLTASNRLSRLSSLSALCVALALTVSGSWNIAAAQAKPATIANLAVTSAGTAVTTVSSGSVVTLTATVTAGTTRVTPGQVNFCDATAKYCSDIHLLGTAQLTSAGTATLKLRPGVGSHSYKAVFLGTNTYAGSSSSASALAATGKLATTTTLGQLAVPGGYTLTATVTGIINTAGTPAPTGSVSFVDTTNSNSVAGTAAVSSGKAAMSFSGSLVPLTVPAGMGIATADFNGDGIPDLAVGAMNDETAALTILLGNGDGTFTAVTPNPVVGYYPFSVIAGDFNGDGIPDLAVGNVMNSTVSILLGKGDGTFTSEPELNTGGGVGSLVTADFNGDGIPDLAVVAGSSVLVFMGKGDGTFGPTPVSLLAGTSPAGIAAGDLNGDGIMDLVVANDAESGSVTEFLGNGDGTFKAGNAISGTGEGSVGVAIADFNGDGIPDLAITNSSGESVSILLGKGDGTFQPPVSYPVPEPYYLQSIFAVDFNGDGIADLAIGLGYEGAAILLGNGDGTFGSPVYAGETNFYSSGFIAVADFNGDGLPDIAGPDQTISNLGVFLNQQSQTVTATLNDANPPGPGTQLIEASYPGDSNFAPSISATTSLPALTATPVISPASGTYTTAQLITITDTTPGATIYYEANGAIYTGGFVPYTGPIPMEGTGTLTIQAYAAEAGYQQNQYATATYTFSFPPAAAPVFSPTAGSYPGPQKVTISDTTPGAAIYYTTNGIAPTTASAQYTGPIRVSSSETLVASAIALGYSMSVPASAEYVVDSASSSFIYTVAGNGIAGYTGDGGPATVADLNTPSGVAVVPAGLPGAGDIYVADSNNNVVRMVAAGTGIVTTVAGTGIGGYSGDNGPATSAQLLYPSAVAADTAGNLWILDEENQAIRTVSAATGTITSVNLNGLSYPRAFALDGSNNLYVVAYTQIWEVAGSTNTLIAGSGIEGYSGDNGPATSATFGDPEGIVLDSSGNLYIADTFNSVIREVNKSSGIITTVAGDSMFEGTAGGYGGSGSPGYTGDGGPATSAKLDWPSAVAVDGAGNLYIDDYFNLAIRKLTASTGIITTVTGDGQACEAYSGDGGPASGAAICEPQGIAVDSAGDLYIAETPFDRIREVTAPGLPPTATTAAPVLSVAAGTYVGSQSVTITDATPGAVLYVQMIAPSSGAPANPTSPTAGPGYYRGPFNVTGTATIQVVAVAPGYLPSSIVTAAYTITTPPTAVISTVAGSGTYGFSGNGGPATSAELGGAQGLALDKAGNIYFTDENNNVVWMVAQGTGTISIVAGNGTWGYAGDIGLAVNAELRQPAAVAVDSAGNLYIADTGNGVVREVSAGTGVITTVAGHYGAYPVPGNGDGGPATAAYLYNPTALVFDKAGNLYIAQSSYNAVRVISATTGIITTFAGGASGIETSANNGDGGPATKALLYYPVSLAFDTAGNLYIGDENGGRVRMVAANTGIITTVAGDGDPGSSGDGGLATKAEVTAQGLAVDASGNLYISGNGPTVREVTASTGVIAPVVGNGFYGYSGDGGSATAAGIEDPQGIAFDVSGNLCIADLGNRRIREVTFPGPAPAPAFNIAAGTYHSIQPVSITDSVQGATFYYTTNGTTPTTGSALYGGPISVSSSETLQAIAVATGYTESAVTTAAYTIQLPVTPTITWPTPAAITYGIALSATQLNAKSTVAGTFAYTPAAGTVLTAGPQTLSVTFTPNDTTDYTTATASVALQVNQATPTITWPVPAAITYGTVLSTTQLNASSAVAGSFVYSPALGTVLTTGSHTLSVTFTPTDSTDYTTATTTVPLTVNTATPAITWAAPAAITYGTALGVTQLDATSTVAGTFSYTPPSGAVLSAGTQTLKTTFTPTDTIDYTTATDTVQLTVNKAVPTVTATPSSSSILTTKTLSVAVLVSDGSGNPTPTGAVTLSGGEYTSAAVTLSGGAATINIPANSLSAGSDTLTVTYTPDSASSPTYNSATGTASETVSAPGPTASTVTVTPSSMTITDEQTDIVSIAVTGTGSAAPSGTVTLSSGSYGTQQTLSGGAASFNIPAGALNSGANTLTAVYSGDATFNSSKGTASVTVSQVVITVPAPSAVNPGGDATATVTLSAGSTYSGTMNMACTLVTSPAGAQDLPVCSLSPSSVAITAGGNGTTKLTVTTTASSTSSLARPSGQIPWRLGSGGVVLAALMLFGIPAKRRRWLSTMVLLAVVAVAGVIGCGGGQSSPPPVTNPGTTAGDYTFTVTGTDSANSTITTSTIVKVTVQ